MRLRALGSSGGYPSADNPNTGFLLEDGETRVWLDAGTGTFSELQKAQDPTQIDAVVLSHLHADHWLDLNPYYIARRFHSEELPRLPVYSPPGPREIMGAVAREGAEKLDPFFDFRPVDEGDEIELGGMRLTFARMDHPIHTLAVRADSGSAVLTFSADTGPGSDLAGFARGSDLLVCEATYQEGKKGAPVHLTARQAGETARRAEVTELGLTHIWPAFDRQVSLDEAREVTGEIPVRLVLPGTVFEVGR